MRAEIALMSGSAFAVTHHAFSSGAGRTSDGNGSHASTLKSPSYTKSVSWQHYRLAEEDPASATRPFRTEVKRSRLLIDEYLLIRKIADVQNEWFGLCMDLALVTGQREGDLAAMRWEDIRDGRLYVEQQKTGAKIRISLPTTISRLNLTLADVLDNLKK
ncbi:putative integrase [Shigella flexneri 2850-71]|nr:putative integrase [Shigella flexneri 2850-71]